MALELAAPPSWVWRLAVDEPVELEDVELEDVDDEDELLHPAASPVVTASAEPAITICLSFTVLHLSASKQSLGEMSAN
jgi:hypothetical protein